MRLLSFLSDIERAVLLEANAAEGTLWSTSRMVNFQTGLGRLSLTLRPEAEPGFPEGTIVVQHFQLADGSICIKASLQWSNCATPVVISVYETPQLSWSMEASRIASTWMAGAPAELPAPASELEAMAPHDLSLPDRFAATGTA